MQRLGLPHFEKKRHIEYISETPTIIDEKTCYHVVLTLMNMIDFVVFLATLLMNA
jgi:hypothetical protein